MQFSALNITEVSPVQNKKALLPIEETELGMVKDPSPEQPEKAYMPIEVTEFGRVTDVSPEQP